MPNLPSPQPGTMIISEGYLTDDEYASLDNSECCAFCGVGTAHTEHHADEQPMLPMLTAEEYDAAIAAIPMGEWATAYCPHCNARTTHHRASGTCQGCGR